MIVSRILKTYRPLRNARKRIPIWIIGLITILLIDEYVKEGYLFNPNDVIKPLTHENLIATLIVILSLFASLQLIRRNR